MVLHAVFQRAACSERVGADADRSETLHVIYPMAMTYQMVLGGQPRRVQAVFLSWIFESCQQLPGLEKTHKVEVEVYGMQAQGLWFSHR